MTKQRLHDLLHACNDLRSDQRLSEILDVLVTTTIVDEESTWKAPVEERILFGLGCILNHAGANGLHDMWYLCGECEGSSAETMASAIEGLELVGETSLLGHAKAFWDYVITPAVEAGIDLPQKYSLSKQGDYAKAEAAITEAGSVYALPEEIKEHSWAFVGCNNTTFPGRTFPSSVLNWIVTFEKQLAERICRD